MIRRPLKEVTFKLTLRTLHKAEVNVYCVKPARIGGLLEQLELLILTSINTCLIGLLPALKYVQSIGLNVLSKYRRTSIFMILFSKFFVTAIG